MSSLEAAKLTLFLNSPKLKKAAKTEKLPAYVIIVGFSFNFMAGNNLNQHRKDKGCILQF
jgi:hypothetical protein